MPRGNAHLTGSALAASVARYKMAGFKAWEKRQERDEAVTVNLESDLVPLWRRVGETIKGSAEERREAFEKYAHEHAGEVLEALQDAADATVDVLVRQREELDARYDASSEVPF
jgi:hypothetical protein